LPNPVEFVFQYLGHALKASEVSSRAYPFSLGPIKKTMTSSWVSLTKTPKCQLGLYWTHFPKIS